MKLIIFSDIHYKPVLEGEVPDLTKRKLTCYGLPLAKKLIEKINEIKPDTTIFLGDLIQGYRDHDKDLIDFKFMWSVMQEVKTPFYYIPGNHDIRDIGREKIASLIGYKDLTYFVDIGGYHLVFLGIYTETKINENNEKVKIRALKNEDIEWLKNDIEKNHLPSLVFIHHGLADISMNGNLGYEKKPWEAYLQNKDDVKAVLKTDKNLLGVFSGHQHWTRFTEEEGVKYFQVGSLIENVKRDGIPDGVWFEIELNGQNLNIVEHHLRLDEI